MNDFELELCRKMAQAIQNIRMMEALQPELELHKLMQNAGLTPTVLQEIAELNRREELVMAAGAHQLHAGNPSGPAPFQDRVQPAAETMEQTRANFEDWYSCRADLKVTPIGSRDCALQWSAWLAGSSGNYKAPGGWVISPQPWGMPAVTASQPAIQAQERPAFPDRDLSCPAERQGIFRKFDVRRVDGSGEPGGKHHGCRYFVLDMDHDPHAKPALSAYAASCWDTHPALSTELANEFGYQESAAAPVAQHDAVDAAEMQPGGALYQPLLRIPLVSGALDWEGQTSGGSGWLLRAADGQLIRALSLPEVELVDATIAAAEKHVAEAYAAGQSITTTPAGDTTPGSTP